MSEITLEGATGLFSPAFEPTALMSSPESEIVTAWENVEQKLRLLKELDDDWDGLGATAPSPVIVDSALIYLQQRLREGLPPDRVLAGPTGSIIIEWQVGKSIREIEIESVGIAEHCQTEASQRPVFWEEDFNDMLDWTESWGQLSAEEASAAA